MTREKFISASDDFARLEEEPRESRVTVPITQKIAVLDDKAALRQAMADLDAAQARVARDAERVESETRAKLVADFLPVLDNLDRTIAAADAAGDAQPVIEGVLLVRQQLEGVLRGYGVERIEAQDRDFDPAIHEAVTTTYVPTLALHDTVIDQISPGYRFNGALLRPARVVVGRMHARVT